MTTTTGGLTFDQHGDDLWIAEIDNGTYRIEQHPGALREEYDVTFIEHVTSTVMRRGWWPRYTSVSMHKSIERAMERANKHHRARSTRAQA